MKILKSLVSLMQEIRNKIIEFRDLRTTKGT